jgi:hypothetical protein
MEIGAASFARFAPLTPAWRAGARDRRSGDRRARETHYRVIEDAEPALGPAMSFMAHVAGQGGRGSVNPEGFAVYAALRAPRLACGVCADERA